MHRVILVGLGPIGREAGRAVLGRKDLEIVGAADPKLAGRPLASIIAGAPEGVIITASPKEAYDQSQADVVVLCTSSRLPVIAPQIEEALGCGLSVVSSSEELACPWYAAPVLAEQLDRLASDEGQTVIGVGVNPGFVMDRLVVALATPCVSVERVRVKRVVDAATRREPLQRKVGAGLTPEAFAAGAADGSLGHVGLAESVQLVGEALGWTLEPVRTTLEPVLSTASSPRLGVAPGKVAGVWQTAVGLVDGQERILLELEMSMGAPNPGDRIVLVGDPPVEVWIAGGYQGERATVGMLASSVGWAASRAEPGLRTVLDLPLQGPG